MYYILYARALGICAKAAIEKRGAADLPCVVHNDDLVWDANPRAIARQVRPGLSLREAKTILRGDAAFIEYRAEDFEEVRQEFLSPFLDFVDQVEAGLAGEAFADLSKHPQPLESAGQLLKQISKAGTVPIRAGIAPARWLAKLSSQVADPAMCRLGLLPIAAMLDPAEWLANRAVELLEPISFADRKRLVQLGFGQARLIQQSQLERLESQFPNRGALIWQTAKGVLHDPIRANYPTATLSASQRFDRCESRLEIEAALGKMSRELASRLSESDQQAKGMRLTLVFEDEHRESFAREYPKSVVSASQLAVSFAQALGKLSLDQPIEEVRVLLTGLHLAPRKQGRLSTAHNRDQTLLPSTIRRLESSLGTGAIRKGSEIPFDYREQVLKEWKNATGWK